MNVEKLQYCYEQLDKALDFDASYQDMYDNCVEIIEDVMSELLIEIKNLERKKSK